MLDIGEPYARESIVRATDQVNREVKKAFQHLSLDDFYSRPVGGWAPCDHLRHLIKSVRAATKGMRVPPFVWRLLYGKNRKHSRRYGVLCQMYRDALAGGMTAGRYAPKLIAVPDTEDEAQRLRKDTINQWVRVAKRFKKVLRGWDDFDLDRCKLPHPVLGKITVRELVFFTLYHNLHHTERVGERFSGRSAR